MAACYVLNRQQNLVNNTFFYYICSKLKDNIMKKIYVMAAFLGATSFAFNQVALKKADLSPQTLSLNEEAAVQNKNKPALIKYTTKAAGTEYFSSDFSDMSKWTLGKATGTNRDWEVGDHNDFTPRSLSSSGGGSLDVDPIKTTDGDVFVWFDGVGDVLGGIVEDQNAWVQLTDPLDLSTETEVLVTFNQFYAAYNFDSTFIDMSFDGGTTWNERHINPGVGTITASEITAHALTFNVNNETSVLFRFRLKSKINPSASSPSHNGSLNWQIDDVVIASKPENDVSTNGLYYGSEGVPYFQIPEAQIAPIDFSVNVKNEGTETQTGVKLQATESNDGYTGTSDAVSLNPGQTIDTIKVNTSYTPAGAGQKVVEFQILNDVQDDIPSNNSMRSYKFKVGGNIYARDSSTIAESGAVHGTLRQDGLASPDLIKKYAVAYDIVTQTELTAIDFQFGSKVKVGEEVAGQLLDENRAVIPGAETEFYTVVTGDEGSYQTLKFETPISVNPGTYYVALQMYGDSLSVAYAGEEQATPSSAYSVFQQEGQTTWGFIGDGNPVYVIRMNFDPSLSVENNTLSNLNVSQNFPNPFANETKVLFNLKEASNVSYTVVDLTGKVVANVNEGTTMAGDHEITIDGSSFANGVYYLNITAGESNVTRKMIVNK